VQQVTVSGCNSKTLNDHRNRIKLPGSGLAV
jgi:hypothetical protein